MLQKIQFFSSICILYILTIGTIGGLLLSSQFAGTPTRAKQPQVAPVTFQSIQPAPPQKVTAIPVRVVLPDSGIDLQVIDGIYNDTDGSWTLSENNAHYAAMSAPANNTSGTTFIYGHGTDAVFGKIGANHPVMGSKAILYGSYRQAFTYTLREIKNFEPSDTSMFADMQSGAPRLIIQTCTGIFSEWRTMFIYDFEGAS